MRAVKSERRQRRRDPAPSRLAYRMRRIWLRPGFRAAVLVGMPACGALASLGWLFAQPEFRQSVADEYVQLREFIVSRPEFAISVIEVHGGSDEANAAVASALQPWRGASSLAADTAAICAAVSSLGLIKEAEVRLVAPETLIVSITDRIPVLVLRRGDELTLLDAEGLKIASLEARSERPDLPLIAGAGAERAAGEALEIIAAAGSLAPRIRGLVRVGERRWDAVISEGPRIRLPAEGPAAAIGYAAALDQSEELLSRDVSVVDFRLSRRPTLRLTPEGAEIFSDSRKPRKPGDKA